MTDAANTPARPDPSSAAAPLDPLAYTPSDAEAFDEALAGLPAPPRTRARLLAALLVGISVASCALAYQLRDDVRFAFASSAVRDLGDGRTADPASVGVNTLVQVHASPQLAGAVRYRRPFVPGATHLVFPVAGRSGEPLYVQTDGGASSAGVFTGRLVRFDSAGGRYAGVARFLHARMDAPVSGATYLLVTNSTPRGALWAPPLCALLLAFALTDLLLLARLLRPLATPATNAPPSRATA